MDPRYLGDAVYVAVDSHEHQLMLTTGSHRLQEAHAVIYLDTRTIKALVQYAEDAGFLPAKGAE